MSPATSVAKSDASSRLRQHFNVALNAGEQFMDFFTKVGKTELYTFWPRRISLLPQTPVMFANDSCRKSNESHHLGQLSYIFIFLRIHGGAGRQDV
jgi:hypothetical protein